jgi:hypothetical protein
MAGLVPAIPIGEVELFGPEITGQAGNAVMTIIDP